MAPACPPRISAAQNCLGYLKKVLGLVKYPWPRKVKAARASLREIRQVNRTAGASRISPSPEEECAGGL